MPPTCSRVAASEGSSEKSSTPTTRGPAPRAKRKAVIDGPIDTRRSGRAGTVTERFWKSMSVAGNGDAVTEGDGEELAPPQAASVKRRTARSERKRDRCRIWRTPFLRRRVCRERMSQATRVEAFRAFHGGATLPESHRLRWKSAYEVFRGALGRHVLLGEARVVREVRREDTLQCHDVSAEAARMEVLALAVPVIAPERDGVRAVFTAERDLEAPETDAFGLFGVALRLLDLGDEARVHGLLQPLIRFAIGGRAEFRPASYRSKPCGKAADFGLGAHDDPLRDRWILRGRRIRPGHRIHAAVPAATRDRAGRRGFLDRRDHVVLERGRTPVPAVLGSTRRPLRAQAAHHPLVRRGVRRAFADRPRTECVDLRAGPCHSVTRSR